MGEQVSHGNPGYQVLVLVHVVFPPPPPCGWEGAWAYVHVCTPPHLWVGGLVSYPYSWMDPTHSGGGATRPEAGIIYETGPCPE